MIHLIVGVDCAKWTQFLCVILVHFIIIASGTEQQLNSIVCHKVFGTSLDLSPMLYSGLPKDAQRM